MNAGVLAVASAVLMVQATTAGQHVAVFPAQARPLVVHFSCGVSSKFHHASSDGSSDEEWKIEMVVVHHPQVDG